MASPKPPKTDLLLSQPLRVNDAFAIECGFSLNSTHVTTAIAQTNRVLRSFPLTLYRTIDLKTQSGIIGAVFAAEIARAVDAIPNPIEKGHPDIVPASAQYASEQELRNYPDGLEIKATLGNVEKGSDLSAGEARIDQLRGMTWQAHHRDVRSLMGLVWDFVGGTKSEMAFPSVTGVFYSDRLLEDDWGKIAGTTGRNTKVTGMTASGRRKMAAGAIAAVDDAQYLAAYEHCLGRTRFSSLKTTKSRESA